MLKKTGNTYYMYDDDEPLNNNVRDISYEDIRKIYQENLKDAEECRRITNDTYDGKSYYGTLGNWRHEFYKEVLLRDIKTSGFIMTYPHGTIIRQAERNHYYRGENQRYNKSIPSLLRRLDGLSNHDKELYKFISEMRIGEFKNLLMQFDYVKMWEQRYGTVLYDCLAQHYGLDTYWLDITNDFNTALFFATCYYDYANKCWKPLTQEQTEINEDTKYGYIFHMPQWQCESHTLMASANEFSDKEFIINSILPIGFQPFERCHMQYGYGIYMQEPFPLQEDISFEKLRFRHSQKLSQKVFELMDCGRKIYPHEGITDFDDIIKNIQSTNIFSKKAFLHAVSVSNTISSESDFYAALKLCDTEKIDKNIQICEAPNFNISRQRKRCLDRKYKNFSIEKEYNIRLMTRMSYTPT